MGVCWTFLTAFMGLLRFMFTVPGERRVEVTDGCNSNKNKLVEIMAIRAQVLDHWQLLHEPGAFL